MIATFLVFIYHDWTPGIKLSGTVHPHITLAVRVVAVCYCIELRQACAALAFRLFDWKTVNCGKGVEKWREICKSSDEANEVRNQWIW